MRQPVHFPAFGLYPSGRRDDDGAQGAADCLPLGLLSGLATTGRDGGTPPLKVLPAMRRAVPPLAISRKYRLNLI